MTMLVDKDNNGPRLSDSRREDIATFRRLALISTSWAPQSGIQWNQREYRTGRVAQAGGRSTTVAGATKAGQTPT